MEPTYQIIKYNSGLPARLRFEEVPSDWCRGEPHWHREPELIYVHDGEVWLTTANQTRLLKRGEAFIVNSGEIHMLEAENARLLSVHLFYDFIRQFEPKLDGFDFGTEEGAPEQRELLTLMQKLCALERSRGDPYVVFREQSQLMKLIRLLLTKCKRQKQISVYGSDNIRVNNKRIIENYIEAHFREKITLADIAETLGRNEYYMSLYFKQLMGVGFCDYLKKVRAKHAVEDLKTLDISIEEIALRNGFGNRNLITKACKLFYGVTPVQLKKQQHGKAVSLPVEISA